MSQLLNELFVHGETPKSDKEYYIIAYKKDLIIINPDEGLTKEQIQVMKKWFPEDHMLYNAIENDIQEGDDSFEILVHKTELPVNVFVGKLTSIGSLISVQSGASSSTAPVTSDLGRKVQKALNVDWVGDTVSDIFHDEDNFFIGQVSDIAATQILRATMFHGTSLAQLDNIFRVGIAPRATTGVESKFHVKHNDKVFFSTSPNKAFFHSNVAAENDNSFPIFLTFRAPDPAKIVLDYDIALNVFSDIIEQNPEAFELSKQNPKDEIAGWLKADANNLYRHLSPKDRYKIAMQVGVYGYKGRIPASQIKQIILPRNALECYAMMTDENDSLQEFAEMSFEVGEYYNKNILQEIDHPRDWLRLTPERFRTEVKEYQQDFRENPWKWDLEGIFGENDDEDLDEGVSFYHLHNRLLKEFKQKKFAKGFVQGAAIGGQILGGNALRKGADTEPQTQLVDQIPDVEDPIEKTPDETPEKTLEKAPVDSPIITAKDVYNLILMHETYGGKIELYPFPDPEEGTLIGVGFNIERGGNVESLLREVGIKDSIETLIAQSKRGDKTPRITRQQAIDLFKKDIELAIDIAKNWLGPDREDEFAGLPKEAQMVLTDMAYTLGQSRMKKFMRLKQAMLDHDWAQAKAEMIDSQWYTQVGKNRSSRLINMLEGLSNEN